MKKKEKTLEEKYQLVKIRKQELQDQYARALADYQKTNHKRTTRICKICQRTTNTRNTARIRQP